MSLIHRFFRKVGARPARVVFPCLRIGKKELRFTFAPPVAATATLGEGDASILATAKTAGVAGNDLTVAIVIEENSTALSVAETDGDVVVTSGDKRRMIVTADFGDGEVTVELFYVDEIESAPAYADSATNPTYQIFVDDSEWLIARGVDSFLVPVTSSFPDAENWEEATATGTTTGTPTVTASPATAAQTIALDQSALPVTLAPPEGTDGSDPLAAVAETSLTGGADAIRTRV